MLELVIVVLLVFLGVQEYLNRKERKGLLEMIMAKNLQDLSDLESRRKTKPEKVVDEPILLTDVPDDKFDQYIADINNQDQ